MAQPDKVQGMLLPKLIGTWREGLFVGRCKLQFFEYIPQAVGF